MFKKTQKVSENYTDQEYLNFDRVVNDFIFNFKILSDAQGRLVFSQLNLKDKEHLLFLKTILMARDIYNVPIFIHGSWWDFLKLNFKIRRHFHPIKKIIYNSVDEKDVIHVPAFLNDLRAIHVRNYSDNFIYQKIYDAYYEGSF